MFVADCTAPLDELDSTVILSVVDEACHPGAHAPLIRSPEIRAATVVVNIFIVLPSTVVT